MPVIARFQGIVIKMYFGQREHNPPHIHAICGEHVGVFDLDQGKMYEGDLASKSQEIVEHFIVHYRRELIQMWETQQFIRLPPTE